MPDNDTRTEPQSRSEQEAAEVGKPPQQPHGENAQAQRDAEQDEQIKSLRRRERILFWIAALGLFVAAVSAVVSGLQWDVMRKQLKDARAGAVQQQVNTIATLELMAQQARASQYAAIAMQDAAAQNKRAADASTSNVGLTERIAKSSEGSIETTHNALRMDQRAQLGVNRSSDMILVVGETPTVQVFISNTGKTPAVGTKIRWVMEYVPQGAAQTFEERFSKFIDPKNRVVFPGTDIVVHPNLGFLLTQDQADSIALRTAKIFVHIRLTYRDTFKVDHRMGYCGEWDPAVKGLVGCGLPNTDYTD